MLLVGHVPSMSDSECEHGWEVSVAVSTVHLWCKVSGQKESKFVPIEGKQNDFFKKAIVIF